MTEQSERGAGGVELTESLAQALRFIEQQAARIGGLERERDEARDSAAFMLDLVDARERLDLHLLSCNVCLIDEGQFAEGTRCDEWSALQAKASTLYQESFHKDRARTYLAELERLRAEVKADAKAMENTLGELADAVVEKNELAQALATSEAQRAQAEFDRDVWKGLHADAVEGGAQMARALRDAEAQRARLEAARRKLLPEFEDAPGPLARWMEHVARAALETPPSAAPNHSPECQVSRRYPWAAELSCTCAAPSGTDSLAVRADVGEA
jgi:hypothetical protein